MTTPKKYEQLQAEVRYMRAQNQSLKDSKAEMERILKRIKDSLAMSRRRMDCWEDDDLLL